MIDEDDWVIGNGYLQLARGAIFPSHMVHNHVGHGSGLLVRRAAALAVGGFDPSYVARGIGGCEDRDFQLRLLQRYKMDLVREYLIGYRIYPGNMSSNRKAMALSTLAVCETFSTDPRLPQEIRSMALVSHQCLAMYDLLWGGYWRESMRNGTKALLRDPAFFLSLILPRIVPVLWRRARKHIFRLLPATRRLASKAGKPSAFAAFTPEEGLRPPDRVRRRFRDAALARHDARFAEQLHG